ncbi:MAG: rod shape-determining protein MreD [Spirochaetaceae bacterium]|nr:rod shape-determining protein MreD [Spirochaetaceae bacterium]
MIIQILMTSTVGVFFGIFQSVFFSKIMPLNIVPDIALLLLIAASWRYGSFTGEISGFIIGISLDALGLAPLGFHAFIYTLIGYLFGRMQGSVSPGTIFLPVIAAAAATFLKYGGSFIISLIFGLNSGASRYFSLNTVWELLVNLLVAPLIFLLVSYASRLFEGKRGGFN